MGGDIYAGVNGRRRRRVAAESATAAAVAAALLAEAAVPRGNGGCSLSSSVNCGSSRSNSKDRVH